MIDWDARVYLKAGRNKHYAAGWDVRFGISYEPRHQDSLVDGETIPAGLIVWLGLWWLEFSYKSRDTLMDEAQRLHALR